jgi:3-hydroxybutyryl-CoA dehydratase
MGLPLREEEKRSEEIKVGNVLRWERSFTEDDVATFAKLTGDTGRHHVKRDVLGRVMVHGLLTASLPTKIGGDVNFIASELSFEFLLPVYTGDTVRCEVQVKRVTQEPKGTRLFLHMSCSNQSGKEVLRGTALGIILKDNSRSRSAVA